jgi:hypothetical protein
MKPLASREGLFITTVLKYDQETSAAHCARFYFFLLRP